MSQDHTKLVIPLQCGDQRYHITVTTDGDMFVAYGEGFLNLQESNCAFSQTLEGAIKNFLYNFGKDRKWTNLTQEEIVTWVRHQEA